jgi:hypothetical protein
MIPGILGGLVVAVLLRRMNRARPVPIDPARAEPLSTDIINIAHIKVAGVGGLGLVAMAIIVAVGIPEIGRSLAVGLLAGALLAVTLILFNRPRA